jgi:hypothetical protein
MREPITAAKSSSTEISAELKPVAPFWQRIVAMMFVVGGVGGFTLLLGSWWSVVFSVSVLAGMGAVLAYWSRDKTVKVTIVPADDCVLINDPSRPGLLYSRRYIKGRSNARSVSLQVLNSVREKLLR